MTRSRLVTLLVLVIAVVGCGSGEGRAARSKASKPADATSPAARLREIVGDDGSVSTDEALRAFAATFGPIPGYEHERAITPTTDEVVFGDLPLRWVLRHRDELTDEQRVAISARLAPPEEKAGVQGRSRSGISATRVELERIAQTMKGRLEAALGRPLGLSITVVLTGAAVPGGFAATDRTRSLLSRDLNGDLVAGDTCLIQVGTSLANHPRGGEAQRSALAHEVYHCFQEEAFDAGDLAATPDWYHEGSAAYVGEAIGGESTSSLNWWNQYLRGDGSGSWSLDGADYDAIGFWGSLGSDGVDVFGVLGHILEVGAASGTAITSIVESMAGGSQVVSHLGTGSAQRSEWGPRWIADGPGARFSRAQRGGGVTINGNGTLGSGSGNQVAQVQFAQQGSVVMTLSGSGYGAYQWGGTEVSIDGPISGRWCGIDPCVCPDGSPVPGGPYEPWPSGDPMVMGLGGFGTRTSGVTFTVTSIDELCRPSSTTTTASHGPGPTATVSGSGGGSFGGQGDDWCTAEMTGGGWIMNIGQFGPGHFSIVTGSVPTGAGPMTDAGILWGGRYAIGATTAVLTFDAGLRSGTFSGSAIDSSTLGTPEHTSGTFDCGDGGRPPGGAAPWHGN